MRTLLQISALAVAMMFVVPTSLLASDPLDGTWILDVAASTFDPGPARKSETRIYSADGRTIHMIAQRVSAGGKQTSVEYLGVYDGKDYPVTGDPTVDAIAQVRVDDYTVKATTKRGGKITATSTHVVSKDGRTMTITDTGGSENGVTYENTLVFHKR